MTVVEYIKSNAIVWENILHPTVDTVEALHNEYGFHELDLEDCLSKRESPKIEEHPNYLFVVLQFPVHEPGNNQITIAPLNIFIGEKFFITLSNGNIRKLEEIFHRFKEKSSQRKETFKNGTGYLLYLIMDELFDLYNTQLVLLNRQVLDIEADIFEGSILRDRLFEIMNIKRQIINLRRSLTPQSSIVFTLEKLHKRFIHKDLNLYFDDVADKISRAKNSLESLGETIEAIDEANEALTSHNTNRVMKILTIFSVTLLPLNLLAGVYGMNVQLPYSEDARAFAGIVLVMIVSFSIAMGVIKLKRLF